MDFFVTHRFLITELVLNQFPIRRVRNSFRLLRAMRWPRNQPTSTGLVLAVAPEAWMNDEDETSGANAPTKLDEATVCTENHIRVYCAIDGRQRLASAPDVAALAAPLAGLKLFFQISDGERHRAGLLFLQLEMFVYRHPRQRLGRSRLACLRARRLLRHGPARLFDQMMDQAADGCQGLSWL